MSCDNVISLLDDVASEIIDLTQGDEEDERKNKRTKEEDCSENVSSPSFSSKVGTLTSLSQLLNSKMILDLPTTLKNRVQVTVDGPLPHIVSPGIGKPSYILYLPTVVLRRQHNPALALSCRLANAFKVPLIVFATVQVQDADGMYDCCISSDRHSSQPPPKVVGTARRVAFTLQALQQATKEWKELGATVYVVCCRHDPLDQNIVNLIHNGAVAVVQDEPFVNPYLRFCQQVEKICRGNIRNDGGNRSTTCVPCVRVDGSTTVAPVDVLHNVNGKWKGVPAKAWMWQKKTDPMRRAQLLGVVKDGHLNAPPLSVVATEAAESQSIIGGNTSTNDSVGLWTADDFFELDIDHFVMKVSSSELIDKSVPPCSQTHGAKGWDRWQHYKAMHLKQYANRRNDITKPLAVSRLSCYLNLGTISIFQIIYEILFLIKNTSKFQDEIIKWREISYAHTFANANDYYSPAAVPNWARDWWTRTAVQTRQSTSTHPNCFENLINCQSVDATWNAMQEYLEETGELHNNARMTWGKTMVHWLVDQRHTIPRALAIMGVLNDRFALDGISPPSYAGLLWCWGWGDKPGSGGSISSKWASKYRRGPNDFTLARELLLKNQDKSPATGIVNARPAIFEVLEKHGRQREEEDLHRATLQRTLMVTDDLAELEDSKRTKKARTGGFKATKMASNGTTARPGQTSMLSFLQKRDVSDVLEQHHQKTVGWQPSNS